LRAELDEVVVRRYACQAAAGGQQLAVAEQAPRPKPPSCTLRGSMFEMTVQLWHQQGQQPKAVSDSISDSISDPQRYVQQLLAGSGPGAGGAAGGAAAQAMASTHLPASAEEVVACLQQLLEMMQVLAPPVRLLMRLQDVLMQARGCNSGTRAASRQQAAPLCQHLPRLCANMCIHFPAAGTRWQAGACERQPPHRAAVGCIPASPAAFQTRWVLGCWVAIEMLNVR
jgi:hypothetical protein